MKHFFLLISLFFILYSLFLIHPAHAITESSGDLEVTYDEPLFPSTIIWYPGLSVARSFTVKNVGRSTHIASLRASNTSQKGNIANNLFFRVDGGGANRYGDSNDKTLKNFWDNGETSLSDIGFGNTTTYTITVTMPSTLGNEFQGRGAIFDLDVGFVGTESKVTVNNTGTAPQIANTPTVSLVTPSVTSEFSTEILGVATPSGTLKPTGEIKGEQTNRSLKWFLIFILGAGGTSLLYWIYRWKHS